MAAANVRASRTKTGTFEPLRSHRDFRDIVAAPGAGEPTPLPGDAARSKKAVSPAKHRAGVPHIPLEPKKTRTGRISVGAGFSPPTLGGLKAAATPRPTETN